MKRFLKIMLSLLLVMLLVFSVTSCDKQKDTETEMPEQDLTLDQMFSLSDSAEAIVEEKEGISGYYIYDCENDKIPELCIAENGALHFYETEIDSFGYVLEKTISVENENYILCTHPERKGLVLVEFSKDKADVHKGRTTGYLVVDNGGLIDKKELFTEEYPIDEEDLGFNTYRPSDYFGMSPVWNPSSKISNSKKINIYAPEDMSGIRFYFKYYGKEIDAAMQDLLNLRYYKKFAKYDIDKDGQEELILCPEHEWEKQCFKLSDGKLVNVGKVFSKYGLCEYNQNGIIGKTGGTGNQYYAYYYIYNDSLYINEDKNLVLYDTVSSKTGERWNACYKDNKEIFSSEYESEASNFVPISLNGDTISDEDILNSLEEQYINTILLEKFRETKKYDDLIDESLFLLVSKEDGNCYFLTADTHQGICGASVTSIKDSEEGAFIEASSDYCSISGYYSYVTGNFECTIKCDYFEEKRANYEPCVAQDEVFGYLNNVFFENVEEIVYENDRTFIDIDNKYYNVEFVAEMHSSDLDLQGVYDGAVYIYSFSDSKTYDIAYYIYEDGQLSFYHSDDGRLLKTLNVKEN